MSEPVTATTGDPNVRRRELANAIRALSMDAVQAANSGHPGAPMGMADIMQVLWQDYLRHNPANPEWFNRDRFVLSNGHASMLLYSLLHLSGYDLSIDELRRFRQLGSATPGHPEYGHTPGVETTTGPLGQGLANAVGMAMAEKILAARFNRDGYPIVDHFTYVCVGDGCLMEGISHEACSLAGTLGLGKLIALYDDNAISIDGPVSGWFTDDTAKRFEAYGWDVIDPVDGHDAEAIAAALARARSDLERPSLICCKTIIGFGAPNKQGTAATHGAALGEDEVAAARKTLGWPHPPFEIPADIYAAWDAREAGQRLEREWRELLGGYHERHPELAAELERRIRGELPKDWPATIEDCLQAMAETAVKLATRKASETVLNHIGPVLPELIGGSADLSGSNNTVWSGSRAVGAEAADGNYVYYGVREFAMSAIMNGMVLHGGFIAYGGTFLVFSDYARNALRMSALMGIGTIFVYSHDSIGLGEDGPTHQPIEHAASLRLIPRMSVWRPCDGAETAAAWRAAIERRDGPTSLLLTRQALPAVERSPQQLEDMARGAYIVVEPENDVQAIIMASGSEVALALDAAGALNAEGAGVRVISIPSVDTFEKQTHNYRASLLPDRVRRRVAIEAGSDVYWRQYVGIDGCVIGLSDFGASAPAAKLFERFELTSAQVTARIRQYLGAQTS